MRTRIVKILEAVLVFVIGGLFTFFVVINPFWRNNKNNNNVNSCGNGVLECPNDIKIDDTGISAAVAKVYDAVVTVQNYQGEKVAASGSGFIYKKDDKYGYVMTNQHVVDKASKITLILANDEEIEGELLGGDAYLDLAVIKISKDKVKQVATIGNSESSFLGDTIFTVGTPVGYEYRGTVTRGTLSGKNRMVSVSVTNTDDWIMRLLQIDAAINPGNSGGPLLNANGEVIGVNSLKLVKDEIEGMGFAIPIEDAMNYVNDLESGHEIERPFIGISMVNASDSYLLYQQSIKIDDNIKEGVVVVSTSADSPAEKANLKKGDVITKIDGQKISNSAYLKYELYKHNVGDSIELTYIRDGKELKTTIVLSKTL